ncbi:MAG: DNA mismatch repair endonuclease MutL [Proteobacteria bacterium]|nr:DNA mismatch repair endonuclease MutL [Pseudomonadota bacterium]
MNTSRIIQLPALVANQIAAGEVVERPASVVKELLENSIDSKATKIEVEIEGGGLHLIRIRDNGTGIVKEDLTLAFSRHATSKIATQADLEAITSMGFRGEALASIASVSRCRLISQVAHQSSAWQIQWTADLTPLIQPSAHPIGTTVEVSDLFYNTPVRRKFLRSEKTEFQAIEEMVKRIALAFPSVNIILRHQQKVHRYYPKATSVGSLERLTKICGQQFASQAIEIAVQTGFLSLQGWLGLPSLARRQGDCQYFFVNQRMVKDRLLNHAVKSIYSTYAEMVEGSYPCYVLYLTLDPKEVDVNVHPTKQEVRFSQARLVHDFMSKCVQDALSQLNKQNQKSQPVLCEIPTPKSIQTSLEPHFKLDVVSKLSQQKPVMKRYAFLEDETGVSIVDLQDPLLGAFYFAQNVSQIPSKSLLFPLRFKITDTQQSLMNRLNQYGFHVRCQNNEMVMLQQPICLLPMDKSLAEKMINAAYQGDKKLCEEAGKHMQFFTFDSLLLTKWLTQKPQKILHLSHEAISKMMLDKAEFELTLNTTL